MSHGYQPKLLPNLLQQHFRTCFSASVHYFVHSRRTKSKQTRGLWESRNSKFSRGFAPWVSTRVLPWTCWGGSQHPQPSSHNSTSLWYVQKPSIDLQSFIPLTMNTVQQKMIQKFLQIFFSWYHVWISTILPSEKAARGENLPYLIFCIKMSGMSRKCPLKMSAWMFSYKYVRICSLSLLPYKIQTECCWRSIYSSSYLSTRNNIFTVCWG